MNIVKTKNGAEKCEDKVEWSKNGQNRFYDNAQNSKIKSISFVLDFMKKSMSKICMLVKMRSKSIKMSFCLKNLSQTLCSFVSEQTRCVTNTRPFLNSKLFCNLCAKNDKIRCTKCLTYLFITNDFFNTSHKFDIKWSAFPHTHPSVPHLKPLSSTHLSDKNCIELSDFWCGTEGFLVWNWGFGTEGFLMWNWGVCGTEGCVELRCFWCGT